MTSSAWMGDRCVLSVVVESTTDLAAARRSSLNSDDAVMYTRACCGHFPFQEPTPAIQTICFARRSCRGWFSPGKWHWPEPGAGGVRSRWNWPVFLRDGPMNAVQEA